MIVGYKRRRKWLAYIAREEEVGMFVMYEQPVKSSKPTAKREVARFPLAFDTKHYSYYIDADGDVSRCRAQFVTDVQRSGWIGGPRLKTTIVATRAR